MSDLRNNPAYIKYYTFWTRSVNMYIYNFHFLNKKPLNFDEKGRINISCSMDYFKSKLEYYSIVLWVSHSNLLACF